MNNARWTPEDEAYLQDKWGTISIPAIAKNLGRSVNAIKVRAQRLGLGAVLMSGDYITLNQLLFAVKGTNAGGNYTMKSWVKNRGLPVHTKKVVNNSFKVVYLDEFWKWAEKNRSFLDFSKMEPLILGEEPDWVAEQTEQENLCQRIGCHTNCIMEKYQKGWKYATNAITHLALIRITFSWVHGKTT